MCSSCGMHVKMFADRASDISEGQVIVVGRIQMHPELQPGEQQLASIVGMSIANKIVVATGPINRVIVFQNKPFLFAEEWRDRAEITRGPTFYLITKNQPLYFYTGAVLMREKEVVHYGSRGTISYSSIMVEGGEYIRDPMYIPLNLKINIQPDDRAVYIGTIHIHRGSTGRYEKITFGNDYESVLKEFREKFGDMPLRKCPMSRMF